MEKIRACTCVWSVVIAVLLFSTSHAESTHVWEKVEITLQAQGKYDNPYTDVTVWVDLEGPEFQRRCYGFWDGGSTFCVRVLTTAPGRWTWKSGADVTDAGLQGIQGEFNAEAWTESELVENPCRRGMIKPSSNGHAFEYADGTPFFLMGIWEVVQWQSADQMRHLKTFVLSEGRRYQDLVPSVERLSPNRSGETKSLDGWAYCACTEDRELILLYFELGCPPATLKDMPVGQAYEAIWFDPRLGRWQDADTKIVIVGNDGRLLLPPVPDGRTKSDNDWALKLRCCPRSAEKT